jgi:replicative DNA helicase
MLQSNVTALDIVISAILSSMADDRKLKIVQCSLRLLEDSEEKTIISKIDSIYIQAGEWPSYETVVDLGYTGTLSNLDLANFNVADFINILDNAAIRTKKISLSRKLMDILQKSEELSFEDILNQINKTVISLNNVVVTSQISSWDLYKKEKSMPSGVLTFVKQVDDSTGSFKRGRTTVIAGFNGQFKTTTSMHILYSNCIFCKQNGVYISLDQEKEELKSYILSRHSFHEKWIGKHDPVDKNKILRCLLTDGEEKFIYSDIEEDLKSKEYGTMTILDQTCFRDLSFSGIKSRLLQVEDSIGSEIDFVMVDYIQKFNYLPEAKDIDRYADYPANYYVIFFNNLAINFNNHKMSTILLAQTNRKGYDKAVENEGEYDLTALSELNYLEKEAAYIMFLYADANLRDTGELKISLVKCRFGEPFPVPIITRVDPKYSVVGDSIPGYSSMSNNIDYSSLLLGSGGGSDFLGG